MKLIATQSCGPTLGCPTLLEITPEELRTYFGGLGCPALFEITPEELRCGLALGCPALFEVTPEALRCGIGACPAAWVEDGTDKLVVIGAQLQKPPAEVAKRIGPGEAAFVVPRALFENLKRKEPA
ncbi:MAG TPA: hypothetical protein VJJ47_03870 [Candidatus Paceibacterota bacterium]